MADCLNNRTLSTYILEKYRHPVKNLTLCIPLTDTLASGKGSTQKKRRKDFVGNELDKGDCGTKVRKTGEDFASSRSLPAEEMSAAGKNYSPIS